MKNSHSAFGIFPQENFSSSFFIITRTRRKKSVRKTFFIYFCNRFINKKEFFGFSHKKLRGDLWSLSWLVLLIERPFWCSLRNPPNFHNLRQTNKIIKNFIWSSTLPQPDKRQLQRRWAGNKKTFSRCSGDCRRFAFQICVCFGWSLNEARKFVNHFKIGNLQRTRIYARQKWLFWKLSQRRSF